MATVTQSAPFDVPATTMWRQIGNFHTLHQWHPFVTASRALDAGRAREVTNVAGGVVVERQLDEGDRFYTYRIESGPVPLSGYVSTLRADPRGPTSCTVTWEAAFEPAGITEDEAVALVTGLFDDGFRALVPAPSSRPASVLDLMGLVTAFMASKTLAVAHELDLFTRLSGTDGTTAGELAASLGIDERPADMLLIGCCALGLLHKRGERYRNTQLSEEHLVPGRESYFGGLVAMADRRLYPGWGRLAEAVRTNRPTTWDPDTQASLFEFEDPEVVSLFYDAMHSASIFSARALGEALDFDGFERLLDVGGGSGAYDIELCRRYPRLGATVYDLDFVCEAAAKRIAGAGLSDRITTVVGDFFADPALPSGHDAILLSMILHDWGEAANREILRKCYEALPDGGVVLISELLVADDKTGPLPAAMVSLNMLVETAGRNYTAAEYGMWLREAGFVDINVVPFEAPTANAVVVATRPLGREPGGN